MEITLGSTKHEIKTIEISAKCSDLFNMTLHNERGNTVSLYAGYVPKFISDTYGDYVDLKIDIETGRILNWNISKYELEDFLNQASEKEKDEKIRFNRS